MTTEPWYKAPGHFSYFYEVVLWRNACREVADLTGEALPWSLEAYVDHLPNPFESLSKILGPPPQVH